MILKLMPLNLIARLSMLLDHGTKLRGDNMMESILDDTIDERVSTRHLIFQVKHLDNSDQFPHAEHLRSKDGNFLSEHTLERTREQSSLNENDVSFIDEISKWLHDTRFNECIP